VSPVRRPPIDTLGVVDIYAPTSDPYFRLKWLEPNGTPGDTSGGRTLDGARLKAAEIDARVRSAAGQFAVTRLDVTRHPDEVDPGPCCPAGAASTPAVTTAISVTPSRPLSAAPIRRTRRRAGNG
jgi:hypothetical protein